MKIVEKEYNVITGIETITEREETNEEKAIRLQREEELAKEQAEAATKESARQALLDKLGITAEEAQLLLGGK